MFGLLSGLAIMSFLQHCYRVAVANSVWLLMSVMWYTRGRINNAGSFKLLVLYDIASKFYFSLLAAIPRQSDYFHVNFILADKDFLFNLQCCIFFYLASMFSRGCTVRFKIDCYMYLFLFILTLFFLLCFIVLAG